MGVDVSKLDAETKAKLYKDLKAEHAPMEKAEAERQIKFQKQLKGLKSGLQRSLKLLFVSCSGNDDMMKELKSGLTFEIDGGVKVNGVRQEISGSHKIVVKLS